jgi:GntR family transcriptional regulator
MKIKIDRESAVPYYHQVKLEVKNQVARGRLKPGDMLPSEVSLSEELGISRLVVHRAFRELVSEGLLVRQRAKGTFVAAPVRRSHSVVGPLLSITEMSRSGANPESRVFKQEVIPAPPSIGADLRLPEGAAVVHIYALRSMEGLPLAVEDLYFPADRFPDLATVDLNNRSVYALLEQRYDAHPEEALDIVSAGAATRDEARLLGINKGTPVMRLHRTSSDRRGLPVESSKVAFHAERYQFSARVRREPA